MEGGRVGDVVNALDKGDALTRLAIYLTRADYAASVSNHSGHSVGVVTCLRGPLTRKVSPIFDVPPNLRYLIREDSLPSCYP